MFALLYTLCIGISSIPSHGVQASYTDVKYPCAFIDTVNISGSTHTSSSSSSSDSDGSNNFHMHNWMFIPRELVAVYDFVIQNGVRIPAERHLRACICKMKPCIRFCCSEGQYYDIQNKTCQSLADSDYNLNNLYDQNIVEIRTASGHMRPVNTSEYFSVHIGTPCVKMRTVTRDNQLVHWTLYEDGTIVHRNHVFSKHYCFSLFQLKNLSWEWQPLACAPEKLPFLLGVREWTYAICLFIAVICMVIILFVYLFCTEIRNTFYGVAIKAYALCVIFGYSLLAHLALTDPSNMSRFACNYMPCIVLMYLVLSFYILTFISFNFYLNFHGVILTKLMFWLIFFPIVLLAVGWSFYVSYDHYGAKPIFGGDTCWFDPRNWSIMIYLYAPIFVACCLSAFFYIITLIRISERQTTNGPKVFAAIEHNRFKSFWKFFSYTVTSYLVTMSSFIFNYYRGEQTHINYAVCLFVAFHGFGALYALIGKNMQVQNFLRRIEEDVDEFIEPECETAAPVSNF